MERQEGDRTGVAEDEPEGCLTCRLIAARDAGEAELWDSIYRTHWWDVVHAYDSSLLGWIVLVAKPHLSAIDQLSSEAATELGLLIRDVSVFLRSYTGCAKTYVLQFAEHPEHPHVHFHVVPRRDDAPEALRGPGVFGYLGASDQSRVPEAAMNDLALALRRHLA